MPDTSTIDYDALSPDQRLVNNIQDSIPAKEWNELMRLYHKPCQYANLDTIHITVDECSQIAGGLDCQKYTLKQIFDQPSLRSFTTVLTDYGKKIHLCFRPSRLLDRSFEAQTATGSETQIIPKIDMYMSYDRGATTVIIATLGRGINVDGQEYLFVAPLWMHPAVRGNTPQGMSALADIYAVIQMAIYERPTIFITEEEHTITITPPQHKNPRRKRTKPKPNKVKVTRVIRVDAQKIPKGTRTYTCPSWGVIGHFRHYKSGKIGWVNGYTKGPERNDPNAYQPKEYQLTTDTQE